MDKNLSNGPPSAAAPQLERALRVLQTLADRVQLELRDSNPSLLFHPVWVNVLREANDLLEGRPDFVTPSVAAPQDKLAVYVRSGGRVEALIPDPSAAALDAAREVAANYEVHKGRCHSNERYPSPPCDCGAIEEIVAIITRHLPATPSAQQVYVSEHPLHLRCNQCGLKQVISLQCPREDGQLGVDATPSVPSAAPVTANDFHCCGYVVHCDTCQAVNDAVRYDREHGNSVSSGEVEEQE